MIRQVCPFHSDDSVVGLKVDEGTSYTCTRSGHPGPGAYSWLEAPEPPASTAVTGMAAELGLDLELPAALTSLGTGWFEYGLVERAYAERRPEDFARMVAEWGHTALGDTQYSASAYIARVLGRLGRGATVAYHPGRGTGRWAYNADISYWALMPPPVWEQRTTWNDVVGDAAGQNGTAHDACRAYVRATSDA